MDRFRSEPTRTEANLRAFMVLRLHGTVLPDGDDRDVYVVDGRLTFDHDGDAETVLDGGFITPGLVDVHAHLALASPAPEPASPEEASRASARQQLDAGVLAVREPGSPHYGSVGIGPADGLPRTFSAGRFLAPPDGGYIPGLARGVPPDALADAAHEELSRGGGGWAKVIGDWIRPGRGIRPNYPADALAAAANRVHDAGGRIAIHASLAEVLLDAIEAGFDSIEHCTGLTEDGVARIAESGVTLVPTLSIYSSLPGMLGQVGVPHNEIDEMAHAIERLPAMLRLADDAGVRVLAGTDAGMGPHGRIVGEILLLAEAGFSATTAMGAGSWTAREFLGLPGIEEGAPADLVAFGRDPCSDLSVLSEPAVVVLDGKRVR